MARLEEAWTIPSEWYFDAEHHRLEIERVFARSWQHVARAGELRGAGDTVTAAIAGEPLIVTRDGVGALRAFVNVCRHRAGTVVREGGCYRAFTCTYHGWTYGLDGALRAAPEMEGVEAFDRRDFALPPVRCEAWGPLVFANLDPGSPSLRDWLGPAALGADRFALDAIPFARRVSYEIACNWKVYVDNYLEGYHVPRAHPGLARVLDYRRYWVRTEGNAVTQGAPPLSASRPGGSTEGEDRSLYLWVFPSFMLNINPDYVQTNIIVPAGPEKTLCLFDYYFSATADISAREKSIAWADEVQREDIGICESVQRNLRSRTYKAGRYSVLRENGLWHFHELLRRALG
jgi:choline monooxygenase